MDEATDLYSKKGIKISPNYYQKDWRELNLESNDKDAWAKAIEIFKDRIDGRYLKQIAVLDTNPDKSIGLFSGFAIMSLACLLIETLEQFWNGNIETSRKSKTSSKKENMNNLPNDITCDSLAFYSFFQRSETLKVFFDTPEKADIFYTQIRCGLLHQGQTKRKSLIHIRSDEPMLKWINPDDIKEGLSINRRKLVNEIISLYNKYIKILENSNLNFKTKVFKKKMKYIVDQK